MAELATLIDNTTEAPVFKAIYRREELYQGPHLEEAPDIVCLKDARYHVAVVDWRTHSDDRVLVPLRPGELLFAADISAQHELDGILIAWGTGVQPNKPLAGARIVDMAPTILQLLGEPAPAEMDGTPLLGQGERETRRQEDLTPSPSLAVTEEGEKGNDEYTEQEKAELEAHLRSLGYLD